MRQYALSSVLIRVAVIIICWHIKYEYNIRTGSRLKFDPLIEYNNMITECHSVTVRGILAHIYIRERYSKWKWFISYKR